MPRGIPNKKTVRRGTRGPKKGYASFAKEVEKSVKKQSTGAKSVWMKEVSQSILQLQALIASKFKWIEDLHNAQYIDGFNQYCLNALNNDKVPSVQDFVEATIKTYNTLGISIVQLQNELVKWTGAKEERKVEGFEVPYIPEKKVENEIEEFFKSPVEEAKAIHTGHSSIGYEVEEVEHNNEGPDLLSIL